MTHQVLVNKHRHNQVMRNNRHHQLAMQPHQVLAQTHNNQLQVPVQQANQLAHHKLKVQLILVQLLHQATVKRRQQLTHQVLAQIPNNRHNQVVRKVA